jgi:chemotaxis signal transduction protein
MSELEALENRAAALRHAFDQSFAAAPPQDAEAVEDLLVVRVAGDPYAIRLREITGIVTKRPVVPFPTTRGDVLGITGIRGNLVPVFSLASLLGYDQAADATQWMVLCALDEPVALAVSDFEGYVRLAASAIYTDDRRRPDQQYPQEIARTDGGVRPVISIPLIVATIRQQVSPARLIKE